MKTIGIIALSGVVDTNKIDNAKKNIESLGYNVKLSKNIYNQKRYLAGSDYDRLEELYSFFEDPEIDAIMCARGGYGAIRLINKINYSRIKNNPKPFVGFSDVTALLLMIYKNSGIVTFHGPMACSDFGDTNLSRQEENTETIQCLRNALNGEDLKYQGNNIYKAGNARGIIWGGNLSTVVSLCGLDFIPDEDFIFFAEDLNEPVYKIDKMFTQLFNIDKFKKYCKGIVLGDFLDVDNALWLEELFYELAEEYNIPTVGGFKITHNKNKITLPIGKKAELQGNYLYI